MKPVKRRLAAGKDVSDGHGPEPAGRRFRVVAPHVPYLGREARAREVVIATYPFNDETYDLDEAKDVLGIFTRTWAERNWPASFEPVLVSADDGPPVKLTQRQIDDKKAANAYLDSLRAA